MHRHDVSGNRGLLQLQPGGALGANGTHGWIRIFVARDINAAAEERLVAADRRAAHKNVGAVHIQPAAQGLAVRHVRGYKVVVVVISQVLLIRRQHDIVTEGGVLNERLRTRGIDDRDATAMRRRA